MSAACPEYGFTLDVVLADPLEPAACDALRSAFERALGARGLVAVGTVRMGGARWHHVIGRDGGQAADADREVLRAWAASRPEIVAVHVGTLVDLGEPGAV